MQRILIILGICLTLFLLSGCQKSKPEPQTVDTVPPTNPAFADSTVEGAIQLYQKAVTAAEQERAVELLRQQSYRDEAAAQYYMGDASFKGRGIVQSNMEAYVWWTISAGNGNAEAKKKIADAKEIFSKDDFNEINNRANDWFEKYKDRDFKTGKI